MFQLTPAPDELNSVCGRVKLIAYSQEHHHDLSLLLSEPRVWEQGFAPGHTHPPATEQQMCDFLTTRAQVPALFTVLVDGVIAGSTGVVKVYSKRKAVLVGRTVYGTAFWGQGLNTITKDILLGWLFSQGVRTVECEVATTNTRSLASLTRMGFMEVGTRRRNTPGDKAGWRTLILMRTGRGSWQPSDMHLR